MFDPTQSDEGGLPVRSRPLLWLACAVAAGIVADRAAGVSHAALLPAWWVGGLAALLAAGACHRRHAWKRAAGACLLAAACCGAAWRHWRHDLVRADDLGRYAADDPTPACVRGKLVEPFRTTPPPAPNPLSALPRLKVASAVLRVSHVRDEGVWRPASGLCRLRVVGDAPVAAPGDRLQVFARLGRAPVILNPGQYDWRERERAAGRHCELYARHPACITVRQPATAGSAAALVDRLRHACHDALSKHLAADARPLALAILLGIREDLPEETVDAFTRTGTIHFLVVSGSNLAMLAAIVWGAAALAGAGRRTAWLATLGSVALYAGVVGADPPVLRAALVAVAGIIALAAARPTSVGNLLGAATLAILVLGPDELFRGGTQLSFLGMAALAAAPRRSLGAEPTDPLDRLLAASAPAWRRLLRTALNVAWLLTATSLAVWAAAAPLVAYHFHMVTPGGVAATPLVTPLIAVALAAAMGVTTVGVLIPPLGAVLGLLCGSSVRAVAAAVHLADRVPGGSWYVAAPPSWWVVGCYLAAAAWIAWPHRRPSRRLTVAAAIVWGSLAVAAPWQDRPPAGELRMTSLAVGHGCCVLLQLPGDQTVLYDAGSLASPDLTGETIAAALWANGVTRIDQIVLSHADVDHYNAVPELLERFAVGAIYVSPLMFDPWSTRGRLTAPNYLRDVVAAQGTPLVETWRGDRLRTRDQRVALTVIHPPRDGVLGRDNADSVVMCVEYAGRRVLLPGDLESPGMDLVISDPPLDCDLVLAPHHGSAGSDPPGFAAWCTPEHVVLSGRRPAGPLASQRTYADHGAEVYHTALDGAITCRIGSAGELGVERFIKASAAGR